MIVQPRSSDQGEDPLRVCPPFGQHRLHRFPQLLDGLEDPVTDPVFDEVPELLAGIEFGTVGRQVDDTDIGRQARIAITQSPRSRVTPGRSLGVAQAQ